MTKNVAASVAAKLKNLARTQKMAFDHIFLLYLQERLLYRLSNSTYKNQFILKGGLLLYSLSQSHSRPTKDIDLLGKQIVNDLESIKGNFISISTFQRRGTNLKAEHVLFTDEFAQDVKRNQQWSAFQKKLGQEPVPFEKIMFIIRVFLEPIYNSLLKEEEFLGFWNNLNFCWDSGVNKKKF